MKRVEQCVCGSRNLGEVYPTIDVAKGEYSARYVRRCLDCGKHLRMPKAVTKEQFLETMAGWGFEINKTALLARCEGSRWTPAILKDAEPEAYIAFEVWGDDNHGMKAEYLAKLEGNEQYIDTEEEIFGQVSYERIIDEVV